MKFSVIVPCYNVEETIARCVSSLINQTLESSQYEIILVDDCSQDETWPLVRKFAQAHENVVVCRTKGNRGCGYARNEGLERAQAEWVLFVDGDDYLSPSALETLFRESDAEPELDVLGFGCSGGFSMSEEDDIRRTDRHRDGQLLNCSREILLTEYLHLRTQACAVFLAVRRQLLESLGIRFRSRIHEDVDYLFRIFLHARRTAYIEAVLYSWLPRHNSLSTTVSTRHIEDFLEAWQRIRLEILSAVCSERDRYLVFWQSGLTAVVATRIRHIFRYAETEDEITTLCKGLYEMYRVLFSDVQLVCAQPHTKYQKSAHFFITVMSCSAISVASRVDMIAAHEKFLESRAWSCESLEAPVIFRGGYAYACEKAFLHEGDVSGSILLGEIMNNSPDRGGSDFEKQKQVLIRDINAGKNSPCNGCPYLEFKNWN